MRTILATLALMLCGIAPALAQISPSLTGPSPTGSTPTGQTSTGQTPANTTTPTDKAVSLTGPSDLKWTPAPPMLPKGAQLAVLSGNPTQSGRFIVRLKMPTDYEIPAHYHPTPETVTVLSGSLHAGMGDKLDRKASQGYDPEGLIVVPAQMHHFAWVATPTVIQIEGEGPFILDYVDASNDPRKQPASQAK